MTIPRITYQNNSPAPSQVEKKGADRREKARRTRARNREGRTDDLIPGRRAANERKARALSEGNQRLNFERLVKTNQLGQDPWDRLQGETDIQWERFQHYLLQTRPPGKLAKRTIARVATQFGVVPSVVERVASHWHWKMRAASWDVEIERQEHEAFVADRRAAVRRQARLGGRLQDLAIIGAENMIAVRGADLTAQDVARLADTGVKLERLAHGDATSHEARQTEMRVVWDGPTPPWAGKSTDVVPIDQNLPSLTPGDSDAKD